MNKTVFQSAMADLFESRGSTATYKPTIGAAVENVYVLVTKDVDPQPGGFESSTWQRTTMLECLASEVGRQPIHGDRFVVGDDVYLVEKVLEESDELEIVFKMIVKKTVR